MGQHGPTWGRQDPGGSHVGSMNLVIFYVIRNAAAKVFGLLGNADGYFDMYIMIVVLHLCSSITLDSASKICFNSYEMDIRRRHEAINLHTCWTSLRSLLTHICVTRSWCVNTVRPTQNGRHFPDDIFKCIFLNENVYWFRLKYHWSLFPRVQLSAGQATSHYLNQWWLVYWRIYVSLGLNELTAVITAVAVVFTCERNIARIFFLKIDRYFVSVMSNHANEFSRNDRW